MLRELINVNNDDAQYGALETCQKKYVKNNDAWEDPSVFSIGPTVAVQQEDGGPWMLGIVEEANGSDQMGGQTSFGSWRRQTDCAEYEAHMQNPSNDWALSTWQIRKAAEQLEDMFMQAGPVEHNRVLKTHKAGTKAHMNCGKETISREGENGTVLTPVSRLGRLMAGIYVW